MSIDFTRYGMGYISMFFKKPKRKRNPYRLSFPFECGSGKYIHYNDVDGIVVSGNFCGGNKNYGIALENNECDNTIVVGNQLTDNPRGALQDISNGDTIKANKYP